MIQKHHKLFKRFFSSQPAPIVTTSSVANLSFLYHPCTHPTLPNPPNLIILHGLIGSSKNFRGISHNRKISSKVNTYLIDLRNHGKSEHRDSMSYPEMAQDLHEFLLSHDLLGDDNILLGHSMGARVTMEYAAKYSQYVKGAMVVDLAPYNYYNDERFDFMYSLETMIGNLTKIDLQNKSLPMLRKEVISVAVNKDVGEVVATNLVPDEQGGYKWRINIEGIYRNLKSQILNLEYHGTTKFPGPVRVIFGADSEYTAPDILDSFHNVFSNFKESRDFNYVHNSGHWVHYSQPYEFISLVSEFLDRVK